jgi:glycopeptide antibiotics resistance protein
VVRHASTEVSVRRAVTVLLFLAYAAGVVGVTMFPITVRPSSYYVGEPWWTEFRYVPFEVDAPSFVLNVIMFVPLGVLVPLLWRRADAWWRMAGVGAAASAGIELAQLIVMLTVGSRRTVDVNDLIANTAGALAGLAVLRLAVPHPAHRALISRARPEPKRSR